MLAQRFVDNNPQMLAPCPGYLAPCEARAIPRRSGEPLRTKTALMPGQGTISYSDHHSKRNLALMRVLWHPGFGAIEYPKNPDRTLNYYRNPIRKHDITQTKTLQSNVTVRDVQQWEDVVISEVWLGGGGRLSQLSEFFDTLHMLRITEPAIGRHLGWIPKDLSFARHMIEPIGLQIGSIDADVFEARERPNTSLDSYVDQQVVFSFKLIRPQPLIDSLLLMEGR